jgi:hypothetical protein
MECQLELMRFGITKDALPVDFSGNLEKERYNVYLQERREKEARKPESSSQSNKRVELPSIHDVLFGRGRPYQDHPGNKRMASSIDGLRHEYHFASRMKKKEISQLVVKATKESRGRFLKRSPSLNAWEEVNDSVAREKASQGFRTQIRINNPAPRMEDEL